MAGIKGMRRDKVPPAIRFEKLCVPEPNSGCWLWVGALDRRDGYGRFHDGERQLGAHKFSYHHFIGTVPDGLVIDHTCRVRCCVNPEHLRAVTNRENVLSGIGLTARNAQQTHCKCGHDLKYSYITPSGYRMCRECHNERGRRKRAMIRAAKEGK